MNTQRDMVPRLSDKSVLVVIPCLNEELYIGQIITKLAAEAERINLRVVVADGGSTDRSRSIVQHLAAANDFLTLMDNPHRVQASGINAAVQRYGENAEILIRMDAHASYPDRYCETLLSVQTRTQADSVVVGMHTVGSSCLERAAAAAQNSILGNGGSAHRNTGVGRWVDHGHHALMTVKAFKAVGGYDETFSHNEDAELDNRLTGNGFRVFLAGEAQVTYYPRGSVVGLFRQYFNIGRGRARNFVKHRKSAKLRHLALVIVAPALCLALLAPIAGIFAVPALAWALLCIGYGIVLGVRLRDLCAAASGVAAMATQAGWSFGFARELLTTLWHVGTRTGPNAPHKRERQGQLAR